MSHVTRAVRAQANVAARVRLRVTQAELSFLARVCVATVQRWENGHRGANGIKRVSTVVSLLEAQDAAMVAALQSYRHLRAASAAE